MHQVAWQYVLAITLCSPSPLAIERVQALESVGTPYAAQVCLQLSGRRHLRRLEHCPGGPSPLKLRRSFWKTPACLHPTSLCEGASMQKSCRVLGTVAVKPGPSLLSQLSLSSRMTWSGIGTRLKPRRVSQGRDHCQGLQTPCNLRPPSLDTEQPSTSARLLRQHSLC